LIAMNDAFMTFATSSCENDSRSITWHQWQVEYPIDRKMGLPCSFAAANAAGVHVHHHTGLSAC
jgi:hypothetical protein